MRGACTLLRNCVGVGAGFGAVTAGLGLWSDEQKVRSERQILRHALLGGAVGGLAGATAFAVWDCPVIAICVLGVVGTLGALALCAFLASP